MVRLESKGAMIPQFDIRRNAGPLPAPPAASTVPRAFAPPSSKALQRLGNWFLMGYLFIALSRVLDVTPDVHVAAVLYIGLVLVAVASGGIFNVFRSGVGRAMVLLFAWCTLSIPFSTWRGGSTAQYQEVVKAFILGVAIIAIPRTTKETVKLLNVVAVALLAASILAWFYGHLDYGRLEMNAGTYSDPNQFAMTLLLALPLWVAMAAQASTALGRILAVLCSIPVLIAFLRTGSRGAGFGLAATLVIAFLLASVRKKVILLFGVMALAGISVLALPNYILARYLTVFSAQSVASEDLSEEEARQLYAADIGSSQARLGLLKDSIAMTLENPVFGVGLGQFPLQNWKHKKLEGKPTANFAAVVTHNVYTQFSSEAGIPALILFVALLYLCFRTSGKVAKLAPGLTSAAQGLGLSVVALAACGFFLAVAYSQMFYIMGGITARLYMLALEERPKPASVSVPTQRLQAALPPPTLRPAQGLPPRSKLSPWRTSGRNVRNSRVS
jgi:O-antigen ligase